MAERDDGSPSRRRLLASVCGLLSILLAVMAGASLSYALSGPPRTLLVPAALGAASVGCIYLRRKLEAKSVGANE